LQGLFDFQLENKVHDQECVDAAYVMSSPHFLDLQIDRSASNSFTSIEDDEGSVQFSDVQTQGNSIKSEEEQKVSDQKFNLYFPLAEIKQSTFGIEDCEGKEEQL